MFILEMWRQFILRQSQQRISIEHENSLEYSLDMNETIYPVNRIKSQHMHKKCQQIIPWLKHQLKLFFSHAN